MYCSQHLRASSRNQRRTPRWAIFRRKGFFTINGKNYESFWPGFWIWPYNFSIALTFCLTCTLKDLCSAYLGTTTPLFYYTHSHLWDILYVVIISLRKKVSQWSSSLFLGLPSARMLTFLLVRVSSNVPWGYGINKWCDEWIKPSIFLRTNVSLLTQWKCLIYVFTYFQRPPIASGSVTVAGGERFKLVFS